MCCGNWIPESEQLFWIVGWNCRSADGRRNSSIVLHKSEVKLELEGYLNGFILWIGGCLWIRWCYSISSRPSLIEYSYLNRINILSIFRSLFPQILFNSIFHKTNKLALISDYLHCFININILQQNN